MKEEEYLNNKVEQDATRVQLQLLGNVNTYTTFSLALDLQSDKIVLFLRSLWGSLNDVPG